MHQYYQNLAALRKCIYHLTVSVGHDTRHSFTGFSVQGHMQLQSNCWSGEFSSGGLTGEGTASLPMWLLEAFGSWWMHSWELQCFPGCQLEAPSAWEAPAVSCQVGFPNMAACLYFQKGRKERDSSQTGAMILCNIIT